MESNAKDTEHRLGVIEIFEKIYDEFEFLSGSYSELDDMAMLLFELYDTDRAPETVVQQKWIELLEKHKETEERGRAVAGLIQNCRDQLGGMKGAGNSREPCLRLVESGLADERQTES